MVYLGFIVSPALVFNMLALAAHLFSLIGTVSAIQHSTDAVIQTMPDPKSRSARHSKSEPSLLGAKIKKSKTSKAIGSLASVDALEASFNLVDLDMPAERLSPSVYKRMKKARIE